jgi:hypothetical protein
MDVPQSSNHPPCIISQTTCSPTEHHNPQAIQPGKGEDLVWGGGGGESPQGDLHVSFTLGTLSLKREDPIPCYDAWITQITFKDEDNWLTETTSMASSGRRPLFVAEAAASKTLCGVKCNKHTIPSPAYYATHVKPLHGMFTPPLALGPPKRQTTFVRQRARITKGTVSDVPNH